MKNSSNKVFRMATPVAPPCVAISIAQSSQVEFFDWLGVIGTTRRRGTWFSQN
jgi:hypothetical protein